MTPEQFCYWLEGFMELEKPDFMNAKQVFEVQRHLKMVFNQGKPEAPAVFYKNSDWKEIELGLGDTCQILKSSWNTATQSWELDEPIIAKHVWYNSYVPVSC